MGRVGGNSTCFSLAGSERIETNSGFAISTRANQLEGDIMFLKRSFQRKENKEEDDVDLGGRGIWCCDG